jgi:hypothetical protein
MPGRLIDDYLAGLSTELPGPIVEELADGLDETYHCYLIQGLDPDAASQAAVAEFGELGVIVTAFTDASQGRKTARTLLAAGPAVGLCWAVVLITATAWQWPVPIAVRVLFGMTLITVIGMLTRAALGHRYRRVCHAAATACVGTAILDVAMIGTVLATISVLAWPVAVAVILSVGRSGFALRNIHHILTS